jgi:hypothetical protein
MGGSNSRIEYKDFSCNGLQIPPKVPIKFNKLKHIRCMFFTQDSYDAKLHIPKSLTLEFDSTISNLENDIEDNIKNVYNKMNEQSGTNNAKILSPIYVAFSRKLEHYKSVFDDPLLKKIEIKKEKSNYSLAISDYMNSWFNINPDEQLKQKYKSLPMNIYNFNNNKIKVIVYIPFMTKEFKYITNFTDIINSTSYLVQVLLDTSFNGLPNVNTFNESKIRKNFEKTNEIRKKNNQRLISSEEIDYTLNKLKTGDNTNFRLSDDLMYLCNEGGCISENAGEDFNNLLPSLATTDSDNDNNAINMSPFLPNKCLAQTIRFKCGIINADPNNTSMENVIKAKPIIDYITENLRKYKINEECLLLDKKTASKIDLEFCKKEGDENPNLNQTPVDIINTALSYQLRNQYNSDFNEKENKDKKIEKYNHYSKDYSVNMIKELMLLRNKYPGIQEIVFPLYKYIGSNNYLIEPPWGSLFLTANHIIFYNEIIEKQTKKYSFNNQYYLKMNNKGHIYVKRESNDQIIYYLNIIEITTPLNMSLTNTISINFKDNISGYEKNKTVLDSSIKLINKSDKLREPYNFYLNDDGKLRVFANGFLDATDKSFITYIDDKINEYNNFRNNPEYYNKNNYDKKNNLNINSLNMNSYNLDTATYLERNYLKNF